MENPILGDWQLAPPSAMGYIKTMFASIPTIFFTSFVIALSGALMPGPLLTVTVTESSHRGAIAGPLMIVGHGILELLLVIALLSGIAPLLMRDDVFIVISLVGGSILLWMAVSMFKNLPSLRLDVSPGERRSNNLILSGVILSAINPYFILWWARIGFGYIVYSAKFGIVGIAAFFSGHIIADFAWYALVSFGVVKGKHLLSTKGYRRLIGGCALFLIVFSGYFFYSGFAKLV